MNSSKNKGIVETFDHQEADYLAWREKHLDNGYIANFNKPPISLAREYPRIHRASCLHLSPQRSENFTTTTYSKACSVNYEELVRRLKSMFHKEVTHCKSCLREVE